MPATRRFERDGSGSQLPVLLGVLAAIGISAAVGYVLVSKGLAEKGRGPKLSPKEENAKKLFEFAVTYSNSHGTRFLDNMRKFQQVIDEGEGTEYAAKAAEQIKLWQSKWEAKAEEKFQECAKMAQKFLDTGSYAKAQELWRNFPPGLRPESTKEKIREELARIEGLQGRFADSMTERVEPLLAKKPSELTDDEAKTLSSMRKRVAEPRKDLSRKDRETLSRLGEDIDRLLEERQGILGARRAADMKAFWDKFESSIQRKEFDEACELANKNKELLSDQMAARLVTDTELVQGVLAKARKNLGTLVGKTVSIGGDSVKVTRVEGGRPFAGDRAYSVDKIDSETVLSLAFPSEETSETSTRARLLYRLFFAGSAEASKVLEEAADLKEDMVFYQCRLMPIIAVSSSPSDATILLEVSAAGEWTTVEDAVSKTPTWGEVPHKGEYRVTVKKTGYETQVREVKIDSRGETWIHFSLKKAQRRSPEVE